MSLTNVKTKEEMIDIIHPELIKQIPNDDLDTIAENLLLVEKYFRGEVNITPAQVLATRIYAHTMGMITQIDYQGAVYKL